VNKFVICYIAPWFEVFTWDLENSEQPRLIPTMDESWHRNGYDTYEAALEALKRKEAQHG